MNTRVPEPWLKHNQVGRNTVKLACNFCIQLTFLFRDGEDQYEDPHALQLHRSFLKLNGEHRVQLDAAVQN